MLAAKPAVLLIVRKQELHQLDMPVVLQNAPCRFIVTPSAANITAAVHVLPTAFV